METIEIVKEALQQHNFSVDVVQDKEAANHLISLMIEDHMQVATGGSMSLVECGILTMLEKRDITYMAHKIYEKPEDAQKEALHAFTSDIFLCSANAVTMHGEIISVDGVGNRVANMLYGPKRVILVIGRNKIVADRKAAYERIEQLAGPLNNQRLHTSNPCTKTGICMHCTSNSRICNAYVTLAYQRTKRIHIILVHEELGY